MASTPAPLQLFLLLALATLAPAQGSIRVDTVRGTALEAAPSGDSADRKVAIYLPPSYESSPDRRYPVVFLLHGIGGTHQDWTQPQASGQPWQTLQDVMDRGIAAGRFAELIVVAPDQSTKAGGSFYTNSAWTGDWEDFTVRDLVDYVDSSYRTIPDAKSRGIVGHSMGGFGAIKLGMKYPEVFCAVYALSPGVLGFAGDMLADNPAYGRAARARPQDLNPREDLWTPALLCVGQALSPNLDKPPFFCDLPFESKDGVQNETPAFAQWQAEMPLYMVEDYQEKLRQLRGLRVDTGQADEFTHIPLTCRMFSARLTQLGIPHNYEEYNGDHRDRIWGSEGRLAAEVFPFFSRHLDGAARTVGVR